MATFGRTLTPDVVRLYASGIDAQAGADCNACGDLCRYADFCQAFFLPSPLALEEGLDGMARGYFRVTLDEAFEGACHETWTTDQPWLEVTSATNMHPSPWDWHVYVAARAGALPSGLYEGHVIGTSGSCSGCGVVRFTVRGISDVAEPGDVLTTWGRVKQRYR